MILILNILHLFILFLPVIIYFIPIIYTKKYFKFLFLLLILVPIHWLFFDNNCILTIISKDIGNMRNTETSSGFSEKYLKWLYKPIMNLIGWKWDESGINKMVNLHWGINNILIWYYLFYVGKEKLIN